VNASRLVIAPALLLAAVTAVALTYPGGLSAAYHDFHNFQQNAREMDTARARDESLSDRSAILLDRLNAKQAITQDVIDGRAELGEAARQFLALTSADAEALAFIRGRYNCSTDLEKYARNVIDHVVGQVPMADKPAIAARLDRQFRARFGHGR